MIRNEINNKVTIVSTGYAEEKVSLEDGEEILPGGYFMEIEIDGEDFVVPIDETTYRSIHNSITSSADITSDVAETEAV